MNEKPKYYHGSPKKFKSFRQAGKPGEFRVQGRRACWFGQDKDRIMKKYGKQGYLYCVEILEGFAIPYAVKRAEEGLKKKKGCFTRGVFVAPASAVTIISCTDMRTGKEI